VVYRDRRYFEAKSKGYDSTIEREVQEKPIGINYNIRTRGSAQEELHVKEFMRQLNRYSKKEKSLSHCSKSESEMLCDFCF